MNNYFHQLLFKIELELSRTEKGICELTERIAFYQSNKTNYGKQTEVMLQSVMEDTAKNKDALIQKQKEIQEVLEKLQSIKQQPKP